MFFGPLALLALQLPVPPRVPIKKDVLLVVLDDVGLEKLSIYAAPDAPATPRLDQLAAAGIRYSRAYANPSCAPSRAVMLSGRYAFRTGFGSNPKSFDPYFLPDAEVTWAESLRAAALGENPVFEYYGKYHVCPAGSAFDRHAIDSAGFQRFFGQLSNLGAEDPTAHHYRWRAVAADETSDSSTWIDGALLGYDEMSYASSVSLAELEQAEASVSPHRRLIRVFAPVVPHAPFQSPPPSLTPTPLPDPPHLAMNDAERSLTFRAGIEAADALLGQALDSISPARRDRTVVIVFGDNGTPGAFLEPPYDPAHGKTTTYEQGVRVPLVVYDPTEHNPGATCDALVHAVDVWATIHELVGIEPDPGPLRDSVSFADTMADPTLPGGRTRVFTEFFTPNGFGLPDVSSRSLYDGRYKYIRHVNFGLVSEELFDLENDPLETSDLSNSLNPRLQQVFSSLQIELQDLLSQ